MNKYGNRRTAIDGHLFDSKHEATRFAELKLMERAGLISDLQLQVPFELIPVQKDERGKVIERACKYIADFVYRENGEEVVEDLRVAAEFGVDNHGIEVEEDGVGGNRAVSLAGGGVSGGAVVCVFAAIL